MRIAYTRIWIRAKKSDQNSSEVESQCRYKAKMLTLLELSDVAGKPKVKMDLPSPMRVGERIRLNLHLRRQNAGRSEILDVDGEFKVTAVGFDGGSFTYRQILAVDAVGVTPHWKAVKKRPEYTRVLSPAKAARKPIE